MTRFTSSAEIERCIAENDKKSLRTALGVAEDKVKEFEVIWPALAESWRRDVEAIKEALNQ